MESRTTVIVGARLPLNMSLPEDVIYPSTANITQEVIADYPDYSKFHSNPIPTTNIVRQFYELLCADYPICGQGIGNINFEQVFHCLESYISLDDHGVILAPTLISVRFLDLSLSHQKFLMFVK